MPFVRESTSSLKVVTSKVYLWRRHEGGILRLFESCERLRFQVAIPPVRVLRVALRRRKARLVLHLDFFPLKIAAVLLLSQTSPLFPPNLQHSQRQK